MHGEIPSMEQIKARLERNHESRWYPTCHLTKISRWSRGRCYCVQGGSVFLVHANFSKLKYLNLEEYSLFRLGRKDIRKRLLFEEVQKHDPLVLDYTGINNRPEIRWGLWEILRDQISILTCAIEEEHKHIALTSLLRQWDARKFQRLVNHCFRTHINDFITYPKCELYLGFMMARCEDSYLVVDFFRKVCTCFHDTRHERFLDQSPNEAIHFFARQLKKTDYTSTMEEEWLRDEDLLLTGLAKQDLELVKLALEMHCPSDFLPSAVSETNPPFPAEDYWPRTKDGVYPRSFNSSEYHMIFTDTLVWATLNFGLKSELTGCFQLIWRAFPVPYLPIEDMQKCMSRLRTEFADGKVFPSQGEWQRKKERLWQLIGTYFEEDFPHEFKPRPLKHLSRYAIRRRCSLSERIADLPLPEPLKRYVRLEI